MADLEEFKKELRSLLAKHNATIGFDCSECSDTYGINDANISVSLGGMNIRLADGWNVDATDL